MVRGSSFDKNGMKKGAWSEEEDNKLRAYIQRYGHWNWRLLPKFAGLSRCGKSCRQRWLNYLSPTIKRGNFTKEEEDLIITLYNKLGTKWSAMAAKLPGRSDNEIKNHWHTHLKKQAKINQTLLENDDVEVLQSDQAKRKEKTLKTPDLPSPFSSSTELSSTVSYGHLSQLSDYDHGNFWTEPFLADSDSIRSDEYFLSPSDMFMGDDFLWSTDLFYEYNSQFMN